MKAKEGVLGSAAPCQSVYLRYEYIGGGAGGGSPRPDLGGKSAGARESPEHLGFQFRGVGSWLDGNGARRAVGFCGRGVVEGGVRSALVVEAEESLQLRVGVDH